jgi:hypothetical protein
MKFEPLGIQWIQSFGGRSKEAPHSPTMKNLPKQNPPLEIITLFGDNAHVTLNRSSKAELGLPQTTLSPRGSIHCATPACHLPEPDRG